MTLSSFRIIFIWVKTEIHIDISKNGSKATHKQIFVK